MRVMISQPMRGKTTDEIREERRAVIAKLEKKGHTVVDTIFTDTPPDTENTALWHLGKSLEVMSSVDAVYFMSGWRQARGCLIEHLAAEKYGLWTIHQD